jgi:hypothetical protein
LNFYRYYHFIVHIVNFIVKLVVDSQNKHIPGKHKKLLSDFAGRGKTLNQERPGNPGYKETGGFPLYSNTNVNKNS